MKKLINHETTSGFGERKMKRALQALLAFSLVTMLITTNVAAATSQGFEWAVEVDDKYNFTLDFTEGNQSISEGIYFEVGSVPTLPNTIDNITDIPSVSGNFYWTTNDTSIGFLSLIFIFTLVTGGKIAYPVGNFDLLNTLLTEWHGDTTMLENATFTMVNNYHYWGVSASWEIDEDNSVTLDVTYLKSDGVLAKMIVGGTFEDESISLSVIRLNLPSEIETLIMSNILYIGIGVAAVVILGAVVCKKN